MDHDDKTTLPLLRGSNLCKPGDAWTCTIQCDPGTRTSVDRIFNAAGAEVCAVSHCSCQQIPTPPPWSGLPTTGSVQDVALPLALVVFGFELLLKGPVK